MDTKTLKNSKNFWCSKKQSFFDESKIFGVPQKSGGDF